MSLQRIITLKLLVLHEEYKFRAMTDAKAERREEKRME